MPEKVTQNLLHAFLWRSERIVQVCANRWILSERWYLCQAIANRQQYSVNLGIFVCRSVRPSDLPDYMRLPMNMRAFGTL